MLSMPRLILISDKSGQHSRTAIPSLMQEAVAVSFQQGHSIDVAGLLENYIPPQYLIENLFKCGYVYSLTGLTSSGKTAIALSSQSMWPPMPILAIEQ